VDGTPERRSQSAWGRSPWRPSPCDLGYVLASGGDGVSGDGAYYHLAGKVLADGGGFVNPWNGIATAAHPPAWPALLGLPSLAGVDTVLGHQVFACFVGTATVVLVGLAARVIAGSRVGLIAAGIAAAYPNFWVRERELAAEALVFPSSPLFWRSPTGT
jgi:hypothetical protein